MKGRLNNKLIWRVYARISCFEYILDTIENSIDRATNHVEEGTSELLKASQYQSKYRRKLCYLVLIAAVIAIILIIVLLVDLKR